MFFRLGLFLLLIFTVACSSVTPQRNSRLGLLDVLDPQELDRRERSFQRVSKTDEIRLRYVMKDWQWPLEDPYITSPFGKRGSRDHEGIDLRASVGTAVFAIADGRVVYSGNGIAGYGNLIVLAHAFDVYSIYAHNSQFLVGQGEAVSQGDGIALSGRSGKVSAPHLHFELRKSGLLIDPLSVLPASDRVPMKNRSWRMGQQNG